MKLKNLDKRARFNVRKNKVIVYVLCTIYLIMVISFILLIKYLINIIENKLLETFMMIGMILATIVVPTAIIIFIYKLISKYISPSTIGELTLTNIQEITTPLKKYYGISDSSIVTKCYKSSNESFNNKDVIIFFHNKRIRITLDFNHTIKDFGCYEFMTNEIDYDIIEENRIKKTILKCRNTEFILGQKATPFIKKIVEHADCMTKLDKMIKKYCSLSNNSLDKWNYFKETYSYILLLISKKIIVSDPKKKSVDYLMEILKNDGPEYAYIIDFCSTLDCNIKYKIGVCVRGTPLLKKL